MPYYDLGSYSRSVSTQSDEAQRWFDRGLIWTYAYNHEEAIACFDKALEADPDCAMAHWGIAYAIGPNYNKPWEAFEEDEKPDALDRATEAIARAEELKLGVSAFERDLIDAVKLRYPGDPGVEDFAPWNDAYADAMREVHARHREDLDACGLEVLRAASAQSAENAPRRPEIALDVQASLEGADGGVLDRRRRRGERLARHRGHCVEQPAQVVWEHERTQPPAAGAAPLGQAVADDRSFRVVTRD